MIQIEQPDEDCQICLEPLDGLGFNLYCHIFHWQCLEKHIRNHIDQQIFPIRCPNQGCQTQLQLQIVRRIDTKLQDPYCESKLKQYLRIQSSTYKWCPTPDCKGIVEYVRQGKKKLNYQRCKQCKLLTCKCNCYSYICSECNKQFCLECSQSHPGLSCQQHKHNLKVDVKKNQFIQYLIRQKVKKCPFCNMWVQRTSGCNHMVCTCSKQFCYSCSYSLRDCVCDRKFNAPMDIYPKMQHFFKEYTKRVNKNINVVGNNKKPQNNNKTVLKPTVFAFQFGGKSIAINK